MIKSVQFTEGYPLDVVSQFDSKTKLLTKKFEFTPGLNILFGPNGCGKSTILRAIAAHGLTKKGWSNIDIGPLKMSFKLDIFDDNPEPIDIEEYFQHEMHCKADVDIDGPVYYVNPEVSEHEYGDYRAGNNLGSGTLSSLAEIAMRFNASTQSTGEACMAAQGQVLSNLVDGTFVFSKTLLDEMLEARRLRSNEQWYNAAKAAYDYAETTILKGGCPTVILDEPENHFSMEITVGLFQNIIPELIARGYQVIVATHFILAPFMVKDTNVIAIDRDVDKLKTYMLDLLTGKVPPVDPAKVTPRERTQNPDAPDPDAPEEYLDVEFRVDPIGNMVDGEDDDPLKPKMPFLEKSGRKWNMKFRIDVGTGKIVNWPEGTIAKVFQKACDTCTIKYYKDFGNLLYSSQEKDYAPSFLYIGQEWRDDADDLVAFEVEPDGQITGWNTKSNRSTLAHWATFNRNC